MGDGLIGEPGSGSAGGKGTGVGSGSGLGSGPGFGRTSGGSPGYPPKHTPDHRLPRFVDSNETGTLIPMGARQAAAGCLPLVSGFEKIRVELPGALKKDQKQIPPKGPTRAFFRSLFSPYVSG